jgi:branched-subunit amino acid ABC-type transport system permease component
VLLMSFLLALLSFAVCLFVGILALTLTAWLRGVQPNLPLAYRDIAFPAAVVAGLIALAGTIVMEFRDGTQKCGRGRPARARTKMKYER